MLTKSFLSLLTILSLLSFNSCVKSTCPFLLSGTPLQENLPDEDVPSPSVYNEALDTLDIEEVFSDIYDVMGNSQSCFPSDIFNGESSYAGLFIRLAWHCAGTFRSTDGFGGCAGGRQRFPPESAWDDNVNLDKARALLAPIKFKFGDALSWGDLIIFAGNAAILQGGGPIQEICAGRVDDPDGTLSLPLDVTTTCDENGEDCQPPIGASTNGLIYVNPQGVFGVPDPAASAIQIREIFGRMGMNDSETVALIGGGHAFGKCHGACPLGAGPNPLEDPLNPWPGLCGDNLPEDTFTSGIEGVWTDNPFQWDNQYFKLLRDDLDDYVLNIGPGGAYQWDYFEEGLMMLTTDIAFMYDDIYRDIVSDYASNIENLNAFFDSAWTKLTTSGGTFAENKRCFDSSLVAPEIEEESSSESSSSRGKGKGRGGGY